MPSLAAVLVEQHSPLEIADIELPDSLEWGQVRVRLIASGICGSQLGEIDGVKGPDKWLPHLLGHEGFGVVQGIGPGVATVAEGDHVVLHWRPGSGQSAPTPKYRWGDRTVNAGWVTTFNECAIVAENRVTRVPAGTDPALAALLGCALTTGFGVVANDAGLRFGESIVVLGAGSVGLSVVMGAAMSTAMPIVAVDRVGAKLELASTLGAHHVVDTDSVELIEAIGALLGDGADVVVETTGNPALIEAAYELTSRRGRTILVGVPPVGKQARLHTLRLHFEQQLRGSHGGQADPERDIPRYLRLFDEGAYDPLPMVDHRCRLTEINGAIEALRSGAATKCLIEFGA